MHYIVIAHAGLSYEVTSSLAFASFFLSTLIAQHSTDNKVHNNGLQCAFFSLLNSSTLNGNKVRSNGLQCAIQSTYGGTTARRRKEVCSGFATLYVLVVHA